jgi:hypothetical protein
MERMMPDPGQVYALDELNKEKTFGGAEPRAARFRRSI